MRLNLLIKAELENVTNVQMKPEYEWHLKAKCTACNEETKTFVTLNEQEMFEHEGSRGSSNLVFKCKFCRKECSASASQPLAAVS